MKLTHLSYEKRQKDYFLLTVNQLHIDMTAGTTGIDLLISKSTEDLITVLSEYAGRNKSNENASGFPSCFHD